MTTQKKIITIFLIFAAIGFTGCGSKEISVGPKVKYANPSYKHVSQLPELRSGQLKELEARKKKELQLNSDEYERLGDAFLSSKKYHMAFLQYKNSFEENKDNTRIQYKMGIALMGERNYQEAKKQFSNILLKEEYPLAYEGLGRIFLKEKQYHLAKTNFEKAILINPLSWRTYGYLGHTSAALNNYNAAIKHYRAALTINPESGNTWNNLGYCLFLQGSYKSSLDAYYKALEMNYENAKVYNNIGNVFLKLELYDRAFEAFLKSGPEAVAYNNLGVGYLEKGNIEEAEKCFRKAIELSPHFYSLANENLQKCQSIKKKILK